MTTYKMHIGQLQLFGAILLSIAGFINSAAAEEAAESALETTNIPPIIIDVSLEGIATIGDMQFSPDEEELLSSYLSSKLHYDDPNTPEQTVIIRADAVASSMFDNTIITSCWMTGIYNVFLEENSSTESDRKCKVPIHPESVDYYVETPPIEADIHILPDGTVVINNGWEFATEDKQLDTFVQHIKQLSTLAHAQKTVFFIMIHLHEKSTHGRLMDVLEACERASLLNRTYLNESPIRPKYFLKAPRPPKTTTAQAAEIISKTSGMSSATAQTPANSYAKTNIPPIIIDVSLEGVATIGDMKFSSDEEELLSSYLSTNLNHTAPEQTVIIRADAKTSSKFDNMIFKSCQTMGIYNVFLEENSSTESARKCKVPIHPEFKDVVTNILPMEARVRINTDGTVVINNDRVFTAKDKQLDSLIEYLKPLSEAAHRQKVDFFITIHQNGISTHGRLMDVLEACERAGLLTQTYLNQSPPRPKVRTNPLPKVRMKKSAAPKPATRITSKVRMEPIPEAKSSSE
ncbi:MAG: hypothetical protein JXR23_01450 [Pontiellaceae bacterium]|nr:hypothetical protein [Pontiellaceae bacterium]